MPSAMRSPVLDNSAFSAFDYFQNVPANLNKPLPHPQLSLNSPFVLDSPTFDTMGSPKVLGSPEPGAVHPHRRSVQFPRFTAVNWARPLQQEPRLFGASMQRTRRMRHSESPSSSDSEPATPMPVTPDAATPETEIPGRTWAVVSPCKGLGVSGIAAFDTSDLASEPELEASSAFPGSPDDASFDSGLARTPPAHDLAAYSETFAALASPANLDELHCLRLAALDLEAEARRVHRTAAKLERRIRRKAAPQLTADEVGSAAQTPLASCSRTVAGPSVPAPPPGARPSSRPSSSPERPAAAPTTSAPPRARGVVLVDPALPSPDATPKPSIRSTIAERRSNFYSSSRAAMSVIEFSHRTGASPASRFTLDVGAPSPALRPLGRPASDASDSDGYASTASSSGPATPRSAGSAASSTASSGASSPRSPGSPGSPGLAGPAGMPQYVLRDRVFDSAADKQSKRLEGLDLGSPARRPPAKLKGGKLSRFFGRA